MNDPAELFHGLWMGSKTALDGTYYDCIVSAAEEVEPPLEGAQDIIHLPLLDDRLCWRERESFAPVVAVAKVVAKHLRRGHSVLVVCNSGLNRSGLVCALAMVMLYDGHHREAVIQRIRRVRDQEALSNQWFVSAIIYPPLEALQ